MTPHFKLSEFVASNKAESLGIDNTPNPAYLGNISKTAELLERVRTALGAPVTITSGYRCIKLNKAVGGATTSDHARGEAADIVAPGFGTPYEIAKKLEPMVSSLGIGQLILEGIKGKQWVHIGTRTPAKIINRIITITDGGTKAGIQELA
jgi:hypothetical protein